MSDVVRPALAVIGAGKVGGTLARLWYQAGYTVAGVYSRTDDHALRLAQMVEAQALHHPDAAFEEADLVLLSVPDDAIASVVRQVKRADLSGKAVVHTSGALDMEPLVPLAQRGAQIGGLHPALPFARVETAMAQIPGTVFALQAAGQPLRSWLVDLVAAVHGRTSWLEPGQKAIYHAALVIASNYTVVLAGVAERLLLGVGADRAAVQQILHTLLAATVENLRQMEPAAALTGPLTRADTGTLRRHLASLPDEQLRDAYIRLARLAYPLLRERGVAVEPIEELFRQEMDHATDNS